MLTEAVGGEATISQHPEQGQRTSHDDMLTFVDEVVIPAGEEPSPWPVNDMERARESLRNCGCVLGSGDECNLVVNFPFQRDSVPAAAGREPTLLELSTELKHPVFG